MNNSSDTSLRKRLIVIDIFLPITILMAMLGGWPFYGFVTAILLVAGWELWRLFKGGGYSPSLFIILVSIVALTLTRQLWGFENSHLVVSAVILLAMAVHVVEQQRGATTSAVDFMLTVGASLYLGWIGAYSISLRTLPDGLYWVYLIFPAVSLADTGGYIFGRLFGRHKIADRVSPKKTWEGYLGGIVMGVLGTWGLAALFHFVAPAVTSADGLWIGLVISMLAPLGDFGESMIKRQFNIKDSSHLLPGHGGIFDRIDSSLWAAVIGFALILLLK
jgi:phosphatidate cytidylyltransferase